MNNETTNKLSIDANQDKPRIIHRESVTLTTSNNDYAPIVHNFTNIDIKQLKAEVNAIVEVYMKDNQNNKVYSVPYVTGNSSGQYSMNAWFGLLGNQIDGVDVQQVFLVVSKRGGSLTDTYTFYIVVYSTQATSEIIQTS